MNRSGLFRSGAVVLGFVAAFLVSEALLQTASAVIRSRRALEDPEPVNGQVRILCVGESTTAGLEFAEWANVEPWPRQLQTKLNCSRAGSGVQVVNLGIIGARTDAVSAGIEDWLDRYQPHAVVTMLGINDEGNILVYRHDGARPWLVDNLKTVQLLGLLWRSALNVELRDAPVEGLPSAEAQLDSETRETLERLLERRLMATRNFRFADIVEIQHRIIMSDPGTPFFHLSLLRKVVLEHFTPHEIDEFFSSQLGLHDSDLTANEQLEQIASWSEQTGNRFAGLRLAASVARAERDADAEFDILHQSLGDSTLAGLAMLRQADFAFRWNRLDQRRQNLLRAEDALPDDYVWSLLLGDVCFRMLEYDLAAKHFDRALSLWPDLPADHELVVLGWLANASDLSGDSVSAADCRARIDGLQLSRFREFTRFHYRKVVDSVRARGIPVVAMQYPLLSGESLKKLLDYRDDVVYVENRANFESALLQYGYWDLFTDRFAGSFGHLTEHGNDLVAENVAEAVAKLLPEPDPYLQTPRPRP